jgi:hypothetical protein
MLVLVFAGTLVAPSIQNVFLWKQLDTLDRAFEPPGFDGTLAMTIVLAAATGYALWRLSNGALLTNALTATIPPSKRSTSFDPLLVLELWEKEFKDTSPGREVEETLQSLVSTPYENRDRCPVSPTPQPGPSPTSLAHQAQKEVLGHG